jgi:predicted acyl esterase
VIVTNFPKAVRVIEHTLIPLKDGTMLVARIWLPEDAEQDPVPAILEYLPYRERDGTYERDADPSLSSRSRLRWREPTPGNSHHPKGTVATSRR